MISHFPAPWRIVEIPSGFAVEDATGQQLGVFYGRADPNTAGHTGRRDRLQSISQGCRNCSMAARQSDSAPCNRKKLDLGGRAMASATSAISVQIATLTQYRIAGHFSAHGM